MNTALYYWLTALCLFGMIALGAWIRRVRAAARTARGEDPPPPSPSEHGKSAHDEDDGKAEKKRCEICDVADAVAGVPIIVNAGLDLDKKGSTVRKLHGQTPGYDVIFDESQGPRLCMPHARLLQRMKEQHLAEQRSLLAKANAEVEHNIASYEAGTAMAIARESWLKANEQFQQVLDGRPAPLQLPAATHVAVHTVTVLPEAPEDPESAAQ